MGCCAMRGSGDDGPRHQRGRRGRALEPDPALTTAVPDAARELARWERGEVRSPRDLKIDPRTRLVLVDIPPAFAAAAGRPFRDLEDTVLHFFEVVKKFGKRGRRHPQQRILCITDESIFQCNLYGLINRCSSIRWVKELLVDNANGVGFRIEHEGEYDMLFEVASREQSDRVVRITRAVQSQLGVPVCPVRDSGAATVGGESLRLVKPASWQFELRSVRTKAKLFDELRAQARGPDDDGQPVPLVQGQLAPSLLSELRELTGMREAGQLTESEFSALKAALIGGYEKDTTSCAPTAAHAPPPIRRPSSSALAPPRRRSVKKTPSQAPLAPHPP